MKTVKRTRKHAPMAPVDVLWTRPWVTVPEASAMTGFHRETIAKLCDAKEWIAFAADSPKARRKIDTQSIIDWKNSKVAEIRKAS